VAVWKGLWENPFYFFLYDIGDPTHGLMHARQTLDH
jgi:hypothetical protein